MDKRRLSTLIYIALIVLSSGVFFFLGVEYAMAFITVPTGEGAPSVSNVAADEVVATTATASAELGSISINDATATELTAVPGIGTVYAQRIVAYREKIGGFTDLRQLLEIEGIGEGRYADWAPYFTLN